MNNPQPSDQVVMLANKGRKIDAIKPLREEHGLGLKQAKDIVDRLPTDAGHADRASTPAPSAGREGRGFGRMILSMVLLGALLAALYLS